MKTYLIKSYGKINLCLNITGKTDDGFHTVDIVSLPVEMHDSLLLKQKDLTCFNLILNITDNNTYSMIDFFIKNTHKINFIFLFIIYIII